MKRLHVILFWPAALFGLLWGATPIGGFFRPTALPASSTSLSNAASKTVCVEVRLTPETPRAEVRLPGFDPALGRLQAVTLRSEGTLSAEIENRELQHSNHRMLFSAGLTYRLPNGETGSLELTLDEEITRRSDAQMQRGIQHYTEQQQVVSIPLEGELGAFAGSGDLLVPVEAARLIDFKSASARYASAIDARLCFEYRYEPK